MFFKTTDHFANAAAIRAESAAAQIAHNAWKAEMAAYWAVQDAQMESMRQTLATIKAEMDLEGF